MVPCPEEILSRLEAAGHQAYFVGGCVRDRLLGRPIHDWDVTTSATPDQVLALFDHCIPTGIRHGTVTVLLEDSQAEVTTFRTDGTYADGRHPDRVRFVPTLEEDLSRRDFTVNAMAMDLRGTLFDFFGGRADLEAKTLRCVGDPATRFTEDALRMLRAWRFAAQLDFTLEPATRAAILACAPGAAQLSRERVREETEKTLLSPRPAHVEQLLAAGLLVACGLPGQTADLSGLETLPPEAAVRWTALKLAVLDFAPEEFRLPAKVCTLITRAVKACQPEFDELSLKQTIAAHGPEAARVAAILADQEPLFDKILRSGHCLTLSQLAVKGIDLPHLSGPQVGQALQALLQHVLQHPEDNEKALLLSLLPGPIAISPGTWYDDTITNTP